VFPREATEQDGDSIPFFGLESPFYGLTEVIELDQPRSLSQAPPFSSKPQRNLILGLDVGSREKFFRHEFHQY